MAFSGAALAYSVAGGLVLYSGIKGSTLSATVQSVLSGNLSLSDTETIGTPSLGISSGSSAGSSAGSGSSSDASSGSSSANYLTIARYLTSNGYGNAAAAGIVACIAGESGGNPEAVEDASDPGSGGEGLIQWTPGSKYDVPVTGNATKDLDAQLPMIISYNNGVGAHYISMLNQISDPVEAADFYSEYFERPASPGSDVVSSVAQSVYSELTGSSPGVSTNTTQAQKTASELAA